MNWPEIQRDGQDRQPGKRAVQLQGPRPSPLSVNKASRKIGKPPLPAPSHPNHPYPYPPPRAPAHNREPVIIYAVSPKVIHAEASDFMSVVQRLTGLCPPSPPCWERGAAWETIQNHPTSNNFPSPGGPISPAARMAVLERASPQDRERAPSTGLMGIMDWDSGGVDLGLIPGILSPAPANLPAVGTEIFSPAIDPQSLFGFEDSLLSPWGAALNYFPSPGSSLFPGGGGGLFSSAPSPVLDISKLFDY